MIKVNKNNYYRTTSLQSPSVVNRKYSSGGLFEQSSSTEGSSPSSSCLLLRTNEDKPTIKNINEQTSLLG